MNSLVASEHVSILQLLDKGAVRDLLFFPFEALKANSFHSLHHILLLFGFPDVNHVFMIFSPMLRAISFSTASSQVDRVNDIAVFSFVGVNPTEPTVKNDRPSNGSELDPAPVSAISCSRAASGC